MKINKNNILISAISTLVSTPLFFNLKENYTINFHRHVDIGSEYFFSAPLSLLLFIIVIITYFFKFIVSFDLKLLNNKLFGLIILIAFSIFSWVLTGLFGGNLSKVAIYILSLIFVISSIEVFKEIEFGFYIKLLLYSLRFQVAFGLCAVFSKEISVDIPLGVIIPDYLSIYNFEQYYVLGSVLCFGLLLPYFSKFLHVVFYSIIILFLANFSENLTAIILFLSFFIFSFLRRGILLIQAGGKSMNYYFVVLIFLSIPLFFPILSWAYVGYFAVAIGDPSQSGLWARIIMHHNIINSLSIIDFIRPISFSDNYRSLYGDPHHQFLSYWFYGGFLQMILSIMIFISLIRRVLDVNKIYFLSFFILTGTVLEPMSHPFIFIQYLLFLSLSVIIESRNCNLTILKRGG